MNDKAIVVVSRKLPPAVEDRIRNDYSPRFNPEDQPYTSDELIELASGAAGIVACHIDGLSADVIARLPATIRVIANVSVGVDHVDLHAAARRSPACQRR